MRIILGEVTPTIKIPSCLDYFELLILAAKISQEKLHGDNSNSSIG